MRTFEQNLKLFVLGIPKFFFSNELDDFEHTDLVSVDVEIGDIPPILQKPYNLCLKYTAWVQKELETLKKARIIVQSVSPWASPIFLV